MTEAIHYLVVCKCTGQIEPIAYIDDNRPIGGRVDVMAMKPAMKQIISAIGYNPDIENWRAPDGFAATKWGNYNVTETVLDWESGRATWAIRCLDCQDQAQMSSTTLERIISAGEWPLVPSLEPGESVVKSWTADGWAAEVENGTPEWSMRRLVTLGVLVAESQKQM